MKNTYINWGPDTWTENRESGVIKSIDVIIKAGLVENQVVKVKHSHIYNEDADPSTSTGTIAKEIPDVTASAEIEETFNWSVPDDMQTSAVYHNHVHPHDLDNDKLYLEQLHKWFDLIPQEVKFQAAISKVNKALGEL